MDYARAAPSAVRITVVEGPAIGQEFKIDGLASVEGNFVVRGSSELKKAARAFAERIEIRGAVGID